jgi:dTMP kinase
LSERQAKPDLRKGLFISFEGGEGSGKSTHASQLLKRIQEAGYTATLIHEPGSTSLGWSIRELAKSREGISPTAELALFAAARAELVEKIIRPEMQKHSIIIADRYLDSTVAYQGYGRGLDLGSIETLNSIVTQGIKPQRTFLLDLSPEEGLKRVGKPQLSLPLDGENKESLGRADKEGQRRFEDEPIVFHRKVRQGYLELAKGDPERFIVLNANRPVKELEATIWENVQSLLIDS